MTDDEPAQLSLAPGPEGHSHHGGHAEHTGHDKHAGHDPEVFRRRFWLTLVVSIPVVATSGMIMDWFGYQINGVAWVGPTLGSFVYVWGGWPFLKGSFDEIRDRAPGMMLLISLAITASFAYSLFAVFVAPMSGFFWEMATLIDIMLLGHWLEMRSVRQASGALNELAI